MILEDLRKTKANDLEANRLTYVSPKKKFKNYIQGELMWVREVNDRSITVFRCLDGIEHTFDETQTKLLRLVGR